MVRGDLSSESDFLSIFARCLRIPTYSRSRSSLNLGVAYSLSPRVALRLDGELEILGKDEGGDEARLWHYTAGLGVELTNPDARTISIA